MSSVFGDTKVKTIMPQEVKPEIVDRSEIIRDMERKRKKKMGAVSQIISVRDENGKTTLGA